MAGRWVDVAEAARELGTSPDVVRKRIAHGSLEASRENGRVLVWLDGGGTKAQADNDALIESLRDQVTYLRSELDIRTDELREHRRIIAALTQLIPELPAAPGDQEPSHEHDDGAQEAELAEARVPGQGAAHGTGQPRTSWWRRVFGG